MKRLGHRLRQRMASHRSTDANPQVAMQAAAEWLARAQDVTSSDGVSAYYDAKKQRWAAAYPETTGYIIPTLLDYADLSGSYDYRHRALRMAAWESDIQLPEGGVRAGMMDADQVVPTIFNTGQVMFGWLRAWELTRETRFRDSLVHAAEWLTANQDPDGTWRRFSSPFTSHTLNTYNTRVAFALACVGQALGERRYTEAAVRNVRWSLTQAHANGWLENNDLEDNTRPLTHTIAYATRGILEVGLLTGNDEFVDTAMHIATVVSRTQRRDGALPGRLDKNWHPACRFSCITGNAQMAIIWLRLDDAVGNPELRQAAVLANGFNMTVQAIQHSDPGVAGGLPGSDPLKGGYMSYRYPNWAAKFFIDALMLQVQKV